MMENAIVPKVRRTSRPKVKTGCNNCKFRRVRCDEARPHCQTCVRAGRTCEGYPYDKRQTEAAVPIHAPSSTVSKPLKRHVSPVRSESTVTGMSFNPIVVSFLDSGKKWNVTFDQFKWENPPSPQIVRPHTVDFSPELVRSPLDIYRPISSVIVDKDRIFTFTCPAWWSSCKVQVAFKLPPGQYDTRSFYAAALITWRKHLKYGHTYLSEELERFTSNLLQVLRKSIQRLLLEPSSGLDQDGPPKLKLDKCERNERISRPLGQVHKASSSSEIINAGKSRPLLDESCFTGTRLSPRSGLTDSCDDHSLKSPPYEAEHTTQPVDQERRFADLRARIKALNMQMEDGHTARYSQNISAEVQPRTRKGIANSRLPLRRDRISLSSPRLPMRRGKVAPSLPTISSGVEREFTSLGFRRQPFNEKWGDFLEEPIAKSPLEELGSFQELSRQVKLEHPQRSLKPVSLAAEEVSDSLPSKALSSSSQFAAPSIQARTRTEIPASEPHVQAVDEVRNNRIWNHITMDAARRVFCGCLSLCCVLTTYNHFIHLLFSSILLGTVLSTKQLACQILFSIMLQYVMFSSLLHGAVLSRRRTAWNILFDIILGLQCVLLILSRLTYYRLSSIISDPIDWAVFNFTQLSWMYLLAGLRPIVSRSDLNTDADELWWAFAGNTGSQPQMSTLTKTSHVGTISQQLGYIEESTSESYVNEASTRITLLHSRSAYESAHFIPWMFSERWCALCRSIEGFLISQNLLTISRLPTGITRLSWKCGCGHEAFDDFQELKPNGVLDLAKDLMVAGYITHARVSNQANGPVYALRTKVSNAFVGARRRIFGLRSMTLPSFSTSSSNSSIALQCLPSQTCRWLHMCLKKRPYATKLEPLHVCKDKQRNNYNDATFFQALRNAYYTQRSWKEKLLFQLKKIEFVEFELCPEDLVDHIIPDKLPPSVDEYDFLPPPPLKKCPPIGAEHMMHLFTSCPSQPQNTSLYLRHIPKRRDKALSFRAELLEGNTGWGLHFVEKLNGSLAVTVLFSISLVVGIVFAVCWAILKKDIQGAFGVASYVTSVLTLAAMTWQMWST
ncbi:hypothetical protein VTL71DRAFT_7878 [Oculimacula yallundae]|uniref:Zn(2)-C6 fungal-type domain-containing protein n=1 Tax=Oculimacula yallundae TaxID=86028 RepID=A0ABR4CW36_9HELO